MCATALAARCVGRACFSLFATDANDACGAPGPLSLPCLPSCSCCCAARSNHVDFSECALRVKDVELIAAGLPERHMLVIFGATLMSLNLSNCQMSANGAKTLGLTLQDNATLQKLWVNSNPLGPEGTRHICLALRHHPTLLSLNISGVHMTRGEWLRNNEFDHPVFDLDFRGVDAVSDLLMANTVLTRLNLAKNNLRADGLELLTPSLRGHPSMRSLSVALNAPPPAAMIHVARVLRSNEFLFKLDLRGTALETRGAKLLCEGLRANWTVQTLNLRNCGITGEVLETYFSPLLATGSIRTVDLSFNGLGSHGCTAIAEALDTACMTSLDLSDVMATDNGTSIAGIVALMEALQRNRNLVDLRLAHNTLVIKDFRTKDSREEDYSAVECLAAALRINRTIVSVDVSENGIMIRGQRMLLDALEYSPRGIRWALDIKEAMDLWMARCLRDKREAGDPDPPRATMKWTRIRMLRLIFEYVEEVRQIAY